MSGADVVSQGPISFDIKGAADHSHTVDLSSAQLEKLRALESVTVISSSAPQSPTTLGHAHELTLRCFVPP
jgi:hypothetical protein